MLLLYYLLRKLVSLEVSGASVRPATLRDNVRSAIAVDIKHKNTAVVPLLDKVMVYAQAFAAGLWLASSQLLSQCVHAVKQVAVGGRTTAVVLSHLLRCRLIVVKTFKHSNVSEMICQFKCSPCYKDDHQTLQKRMLLVNKQKYPYEHLIRKGNIIFFF